MSKTTDLLHKAWGECKDGVYNKDTWISLQTAIEQLESMQRESTTLKNCRGNSR